MRPALFLSCFIFVCSITSAQNPAGVFSGCGTEIMMQRAAALNNARHKSDGKWQESGGLLAHPDGDRVLPVVVHIIHQNGPENISDAQVQQGIAQLNNAFAGLGGVGVSTGIQFCLAQQDPSGMATSGITRNVSPLTSMVMETQDLDLKNIVRWAPTCYINIWVVADVSSLSSGPGVAGYAYFPSAHGSDIDGIVMEANYFGSSQQNTSVLVHEMGHYLGLYHTFEAGCANNNCLAEGDQVCDTPPDQTTFSNCNPNANSCSTDADDTSPNNPFTTDVPDLGEDYMDYSAISCYTRFTAGQAVRMNWHLSQVRSSLLACKSCQSPCPALAQAQILAPASDEITILAGTAQNFSGVLTQAVNPQWRLGNSALAAGLTAMYTFNTPGVYWVYFEASSITPDLCSPALDSVKIIVKCGAVAAFSTPNDQPDAGVQTPFINQSQNAQTYQWFVDGIPVATTFQYNHVFNTTGIHTVMLTASNGICTDTVRHLIFVGCADEHKRSTYWYFGEQAALRFDPGGPVALTDNAMTASQGNATMSDKSGNLLFYSNGIKVYNRNHQVMPNGNGLIGSDFSAQTCLIVPAPGNSDRYYLFTTSNWGDPQHLLAYSVIDMTLNGGLGDIIPGTKNIVLNANVAEIVTALYHRNCQDVWIVSHEIGNNRYVAYLLGQTGISNVPVVSAVGNVYGGSIRSGSLRASHNGKWICAAFGGIGIPDNVTATLARFDAASGLVNQVQTLETMTTMPNAFSAEFSLSDEVLYLCGFTTVTLHQFDLKSPIIPLSVQTIPTGNEGANVMQMGPNGRIYVGFNNESVLHTIEQPDILGPGCGFTENAVDLNGRNVTLGFPNFLAHFFQPSLKFEGPDTICQHEFSLLQINSSLCGATYAWSLSPDLGQIEVINDSLTRFVSNGTAGFTTLQLVRTTPCSQDTAWLKVFVKNCDICPPLTMDAGADTVLCNGQSAALHATPGFTSYEWTPTNSLDNPHIADPIASPTVPTTYTVTGTVLGNEMILNGDFTQGNFGFGTEYVFLGAAVGHFWVSNAPTSINPAWNIPADHSPTPDGNMLIVDGDVTGLLPIFWEQDVALPSNLDFTLSFWVAMAYFAEPPVIQVEVNGQIAGTFTPLGGAGAVGLWQPYSLQWNSGANGVVHIALRDMNAAYIGNDFAVDDISIRANCSYSDTITVTPLLTQPPTLQLGPDITLCSNAVKKLDAGPGFLSYHWQDGSSGQTFTAYGPGKYWVTVKDSCFGIQSDTILIIQAPLPVLDAGAEKVICPGDSVQLDYTSNTVLNSFHWWPETSLSCNTCTDPWASPVQTTIYQLVGTTAAGCAALDSVRVRVLQAVTDSLKVSACGIYTYANVTYTASGIYQDTLVGNTGCDSIFRLELTILPSKLLTQQRQICQGTSIQVGTHLYNSSGTYVDTLSTANGCDSIVTTVLQVSTALMSAQQVMLCQGESLQVGTHTYTLGGTYLDTLQSTGGCDSLVSSQVTVLPVPGVQQTALICEKDTFWVGNHVYTQSGMYTDTLQTVAGCDSIVHTSLTVKAIPVEHLDFNICQGDTVSIHGISYTATGNYTDTLQSQSGCDSILVIALNVHPPVSKQFNLSICQGDTAWVSGMPHTSGGVYADTLTAITGCDSILITTLSILSVAQTQIDREICAGDTLRIGNSLYTQTGNYQDTLQTVIGCDSIIQTHLTVWPVSITQLMHSICQGDTVFAGGHAYTQAGMYMDTLQGFYGCDSILLTSLQVRQPSVFQWQKTICAGDSVLFGGKIYTTSGVFKDTLQNAVGCDSLMQLNLMVVSEIVTNQSLTLCDGQGVQVGTHHYSISGNYVDVLQATGGCDSIVYTNLTVSPVFDHAQSMVICQGESVTVGPHTYVASGFYLDSLQTQAGCDSILHTTLTVLDTSVFEQKITWCPGDVVTVGGIPYSAPGDYTALLQATNGCDSLVYTHLIPANESYCDSVRCRFYIPNAFAPESNNANQYFEVMSGSASLQEMRIYDRWGELLYQGTGAGARWDGRFRNKPMLPGVYVYLVRGVCSDGRVLWKSGDLTLLR